MRIEYAMKSAPNSEAELLALYKGSHGRLRGTPTPKIVKIAEPKPVLVEPQLAEPVPVPATTKEKTYPKWTFLVDPDHGTRPETPVPTMMHIKTVVAKKHGLTARDIECSRRTTHYVRPRQIAAYLCCMMTRRALPAIGRAFGNRDHTTILYSRDKIARLIIENEDFEKEIHNLKQVILDTFREVTP